MKFHNLALLLGVILALIVSTSTGILLHYFSDIETLYIPIISVAIFILLALIFFLIREKLKINTPMFIRVCPPSNNKNNKSSDDDDSSPYIFSDAESYSDEEFFEADSNSDEEFFEADSNSDEE